MQFDKIYKKVEENRQNRLDGNYNSIPWNFDRLTEEYNYPGWVKGKMYLITASSGIAKSKFTKWLTVVSTYIKWKEKPFKTKIFWFALEESKEKLYLEAISVAIYYNHRQIVTPEMMLSYGKYTVPEKILEWIREAKDSGFLSFFEEHVEVIDHISNPTGIKKHIERYFEDPTKGKMIYEERDEHKYPLYYQHNQDTYYFVIVDHISLLHTESLKGVNLDLRETLAFFVDQYGLEIFCKRYNLIFVPIQQQASSGESQQFTNRGELVEAKLEPSLADLADCKTTQRSADVVLGIFAPFRYDIEIHQGYDINLLQDNYRSIRFLKDRLSGLSGRLGLYFSRGVPHFEELPKAQSITTSKYNYEYYINKNKNEQFNS
jgi:hypothetical protein